MMHKHNKNEKLLQFFKEICLIPRQTGDEEGISQFLAEFAQARGLEAERDSHNNILIRKPSTIPGYHGPTVIIQGHMDMVYEKTPESTHNYKDGIRVIEENGYLKSADGTSLGADNGLAVAYAMDLLDRNDLELPPLEILITTGEEVGLEGVKHLQLADLKGTYLINLDAEEEGVFFTSCAGGVRTDLILPLKYETQTEKVTFTLKLNGLTGGHSGLDIALGKANAIKIIGRILYHIFPLAHISYLESPGKANAIASRGTIILHTSKHKKVALLNKLLELEENIRTEFNETENLSFLLTEEEKQQEIKVFTKKTVKSIIQAITFLPYGIISRTKENIKMVQTSSNIGDMKIQDDSLLFLCSGRSSLKSEKEQLKEHMQILAEALEMEYHFHGDYPQWEYRKESNLREICKKVYYYYSGKEATFTGIHAGIECGYLSEKLGNHIDMISCGANLYDVHTPREKADLASFYRMEEILIAIIQEIGKS